MIGLNQQWSIVIPFHKELNQNTRFTSQVTFNMKNLTFLIFSLLILSILPIVSATEESLIIVCAGDSELIIPCGFADEQIFFLSQSPEGESGLSEDLRLSFFGEKRDPLVTWSLFFLLIFIIFLVLLILLLAIKKRRKK